MSPSSTISSTNANRVGLKTSQHPFSAGELNRKVSLPTYIMSSTNSHTVSFTKTGLAHPKGLVLATNSASIENDNIFVPTNLNENYNGFQVMKIKSVIPDNYDNLIRKMEAVQALKRIKVDQMTFRESNGNILLEQSPNNSQLLGTLRTNSLATDPTAPTSWFSTDYCLG